MFLGLVLLRAVVKQLLVHLHEELQGVVDQAVDRPEEEEEEEDQCGNSVSCSENKQEPRLFVSFMFYSFVTSVTEAGL